MMGKLLKGLIVVVFSGVMLNACAQSTKLTQTWVDEGYRGRAVSDILVIGVTHEESTRRSFESKFVKQLKAVGVEAVSSADVIAIPADQKLEKEVILDAVNRFENDAVLVTHLVGVDTKEIYHPPQPGLGYYGRYGSAWGYSHDPGYFSLNTYVRLETNLYNVQSEKLMWSGQSQTWNADSNKQIINEVIEIVIKDMQKNKLLPGVVK